MTGPYSLSGHPLEGDRIVRLVYVDEAGIGHSGEEPILTVGAVAVHADTKLVAVERHLDRIVKRHIPEEHWPTFVFHATHLFNWGGRVFTKNNPDWPLAKRLEIAMELAAIPRRFDLQLMVGICERAKFPSDPALAAQLSKQQTTIAAHVATFTACATKVEHWMRRNAPNEVCMMIVEDNDQARRHIREFQQYYQTHSITAALDDDAKKYFPFRKIKEDPLFQAKRPSSVLQLADFWAYIAKRIAMDPNHHLYFPLYEKMYSQVWELFREGLPA